MGTHPCLYNNFNGRPYIQNIHKMYIYKIHCVCMHNVVYNSSIQMFDRSMYKVSIHKIRRDETKRNERRRQKSLAGNTLHSLFHHRVRAMSVIRLVVCYLRLHTITTTYSPCMYKYWFASTMLLSHDHSEALVHSNSACFRVFVFYFQTTNHNVAHRHIIINHKHITSHHI